MCNTALSARVADIIDTHIRECKRRIPALARVLPVIIPESNIPVALDIQYALKTLKRCDCVFMTEDHDASAPVAWDRPGSVTTRQNKPEMVRILMQRFAEQKIVLHSQFITASQDETLRDIEKEFVAQFRTFSEFKKRVRLTDGSIEIRRYYSGKTSGQNDDFVMAVAIAGFMKLRWDQKDKYARFR